MAMVLAALIGQIGLPGGGFGHGYASMASVGEPAPFWRSPIPPRRQPGSGLHPGGADQRFAAEAGRGVRLRRQATDLPRYPAGVLGGRQSVPPSSGSGAVAAGAGSAGYGDRQRTVLDADGPACRYCVALDRDAGAGRHWRVGYGCVAGRDETRGRAVWSVRGTITTFTPISPGIWARMRSSLRVGLPTSGCGRCTTRGLISLSGGGQRCRRSMILVAWLC